MIIIKSERDISIMRRAGQIVLEALKLLEKHICPGVTTRELDKLVERYIKSRGAVPSFKNYRGFPANVCLSPNDVIIHGIPNDKRLADGDILSVDIGARIDGFHGDAARTFPVGNISGEAARLIEITRQCFFEGIRYAREGCRLEDISSAIQEFAESNGCSVVRKYVGHGIGRNLHESPDVPNFGVRGRGVRLKKGMTLAIEPMINLGGYDIRLMGDGWTVRTKDGSLSAHYENTVAITGGDPMILTLA